MTSGASKPRPVVDLGSQRGNGSPSRPSVVDTVFAALPHDSICAWIHAEPGSREADVCDCLQVRWTIAENVTEALRLRDMLPG